MSFMGWNAIILGREIHTPAVDSVSGAATESVSIGLPLCHLCLSIVTGLHALIAPVFWDWSISIWTLGKGISAARSRGEAGLWCFGVYWFHLNKTRFDCSFLNCFFCPIWMTPSSRLRWKMIFCGMSRDWQRIETSTKDRIGAFLRKRDERLVAIGRISGIRT